MHNRQLITNNLKYLVGFFLVASLYVSAERVDFWWHLQIGEDIVKDGLWPSPDSYSYTNEGVIWVVHSWLGDCMLYILWVLGGLDLLEAFRFFCHLFITIYIFVIIKRNYFREEIAFLASLLVIILVGLREIRPYLFSELFALPIFSFILDLRWFRIPYFIIPLIFILWINIHPESILFLLILFFVLIYKIGVLIIYKKKFESKWFLCATISISTIIITPTPFSLIKRVIEGINYQTDDWLSLSSMLSMNFRFTIVYLAIWLFIMFLWVWGSWLWRHNIKEIASEWIVTFLLLFLAFLHIRLIWTSIFVLLISLKWLSSFKESKFRKWSLKQKINGILVIFIALAVLRGKYDFIKYTNDESFPHEAISYWNENSLHGNVWCDWNWSGYMIWWTNKKAKVFCDTRIEPFTNAIIKIGRIRPEDILYIIDYLKTCNTDFLILPRKDMKQSVEQIILNGYGTLIFEGDSSIIIKMNKNINQ